MQDEKLIQNEWHKKQATSLFNATWDLIEKHNRTNEEDIMMIHTAHASRYHWGQVGRPVELARGEWQISRVYSILYRGEAALFHAKESLRICTENGIGGFDLAFGLEAVARAYKVLSRRESDIFKDKAIDAANKIENKENREYTLMEIEGI